jgi:hypothetical protein
MAVEGGGLTGVTRRELASWKASESGALPDGGLESDSEAMRASSSSSSSSSSDKSVAELLLMSMGPEERLL